MSLVQSFPPIADARARILILGSMPGKASLAAGQYYAHAQNLFWQILAEVTGAAPSLPYAARARALKASGIALWDVLASCAREGSLDSAIDDATASANDFVAFYQARPGITQVFFNGAKAEACYRKHVLPVLADAPAPAIYRRLPSTSPANASMSRRYKHRVWRQALRLALARCQPSSSSAPRARKRSISALPNPQSASACTPPSPRRGAPRATAPGVRE